MENDIADNLVYLVKHLTNLDDVLLHLMQARIISSDERERILNKDTLFNKNQTLVVLLGQREWNDIRSPLLDILNNTFNEHCVNKIQRNSLEVKPLTSWKYETNRILGYGSFGIVISARDKLDNRYHALKIIPNRDLKSFTDSNTNLLQESRIQATLDHPNVVKYVSSDMYSLSKKEVTNILQWASADTQEIHDRVKFRLLTHFQLAQSGNKVSGLFIKTEICGETLRQWLNTQVQNEINPNINICEKIGQGLIDGINYIHSQSILHLDLCPENILFSKKSFTPPIKIGDFGMYHNETNNTTKPKTLEMGHNFYRAIEINVRGQVDPAKYNQAADLYSIGLILSEVFDPVPIHELQIKLMTIVFSKDAGPRIQETFPLLNDLLLKLTELDPTQRFYRDANGDPLPINFVSVTADTENMEDNRVHGPSRAVNEVQSLEVPV